MFSVVFLCLRGSHVTITHDALDFTVQPPPRTGPHPLTAILLVTSDDQDRRSVQTCSLQELTVEGPPNHQC